MALALLEALKNQDLPQEVLDDENVTITLPRRLGLSNVVETQIRRYREDARKRRRISEHEVQDLIRLVIRRPDSDEVFLQVGADLHRGGRKAGWRRFLPRRVAHALARRRTRQRLRVLFGRRMVQSAGSPFVLESAGSLFIEADPGGDACGIITGLARGELARVGSDPAGLVHQTCQGSGADTCRWELLSQD